LAIGIVARVAPADPASTRSAPAREIDATPPAPGKIGDEKTDARHRESA
jgi:hypothetical protein